MSRIPSSKLALAAADRAAESAEIGSVTMWIEGLRNHADRDAADQLFHRYFRTLIDQLGHRINRRVQRVSDSEDVASYALSEILRNIANGRFPDLVDRKGLWALMLDIADKRTKHMWRLHTAAKRDIRRLTGIPDPVGDSMSVPEPVDVAAAEPSASFVAELEDQFRFLVSQLSDAEYRDILIWELSGFSTAEMCDLLAKSRGVVVVDRTIRRKRSRMREQLQRAYLEQKPDQS